MPVRGCYCKLKSYLALLIEYLCFIKADDHLANIAEFRKRLREKASWESKKKKEKLLIRIQSGTCASRDFIHYSEFTFSP